MLNKKIILGIDPGYGRVGIAIIEKENNNHRLIYSECFETDKNLTYPKRLFLVGSKISSILKKYKPLVVSLETLLWSKNKKTALQVAEARGVIICEIEKNKSILKEFNPNGVKLAVTGYGKSDKKQVIYMINKQLNLEKKNCFDDEYDAIAIALTCAVTNLSTE